LQIRAFAAVPVTIGSEIGIGSCIVRLIAAEAPVDMTTVVAVGAVVVPIIVAAISAVAPVPPGETVREIIPVTMVMVAVPITKA